MADNSVSLVVHDSPSDLPGDAPHGGRVESNFPTGLLLNSFTAMFIYLIFGLPRMEKFYDDFGAALPAQTSLILSLGKWMSGNLGRDQSFPGLVWLGFAMGIAFCVIVALKRAASRHANKSESSRGMFYFLTGLIVLPLALLANDIFIVQSITFLTAIYVLHVLLLPTTIWLVLLGLHRTGWINSPNIVGSWARPLVWVGLILVMGLGAWAIYSPIF